MHPSMNYEIGIMKLNMKLSLQSFRLTWLGRELLGLEFYKGNHHG
jgi:hypothetical protein